MHLSSIPLYLYRLIRGGRGGSPLQRQSSYLKKFVAYQPVGGEPPVSTLDRKRLRITWVIPDFKPGAGGHMTIFRIASYLERFGHDVRFLIQNPSVHKSGEEARATINQHFQPFSGPVALFTGATPDAEGDALIATDRFTCYPVDAMRGFIRKFYFVQDYEPAFYPSGTEALLTEATYHFDFDCLCAGEWLHRRMSEQYGRWSMAWPLAYDAAVYRTNGQEIARSRNRIAVYARYVTPRRAVELAFMALEILKKRGLDFEVDFFGWDIGKPSVDFPYRNLGILKGEQLADLYRQATLGVVFSATNHSLVNKEMMACGLPVIDLDLDTVRTIFPADTMAFAKPTPDGIADTLEDLLRHPEKRQALQQHALDYVQQFSWEKSARLVEAALIERIDATLARGAA
ncbi:glycosyltransferase family 4 protein [Rhizobium paknamense]|uniref:Glycosyltransferase involved in cell wall biosynthesis n=1 Tax=Rhizobium paknamense TaxID=1206817 RepID=A0ABU0I9F8_9HYPH|nr:glycosyltransferase family 4 protein [Rhizobium paknamense]MDQ0454875.1 glycosyltransferase involved in cell wall biosynthesis [Rhizobium paknamense]